MDIKQIQELIKLVNKSGINELKIKEGDSCITIKSGMTSMPSFAPQMMQHSAPTLPSKNDETQDSASVSAGGEDANPANTFVFKSPMIGTFYRKPTPEKPMFVQVGDTIKKGDVLCIIEAMKLFNEIEFDGENGRIVKILTEDSSPVEYDQPLFLIEKM